MNFLTAIVVLLLLIGIPVIFLGKAVFISRTWFQLTFMNRMSRQSFLRCTSRREYCRGNSSYRLVLFQSSCCDLSHSSRFNYSISCLYTSLLESCIMAKATWGLVWWRSCRCQWVMTCYSYDHSLIAVLTNDDVDSSAPARGDANAPQPPVQPHLTGETFDWRSVADLTRTSLHREYQDWT